MGAEPYDYTVPYETDVQNALERLRAKVFESGDFDGAELGPATPEEALEMAEEDGTRSILDITRVTDEPGFCCAAPFSPAELQRHFSTEKPTRQDFEKSHGFREEIKRGHCRYVILHDGGEPKQIHFTGYSFD